MNQYWQIPQLPGKMKRFVKRGFKRYVAPDDFLQKISGVIHVGANVGQERFTYEQFNLNVVWFEPIPEIFHLLKANLKEFPRQQAFQYLVTDEEQAEYQFHIASNEGLSSSILDLDLHKDIWEEIHYKKTILLKSRRLSSIVEAEKIEISKYDALVMDTQGTELLVLKGAEDLLNSFRYIKTEAADFEVYKNCCQLRDIKKFLGSHGFKEISRQIFASRKAGGNCYDVVYQQTRRRQIKNWLRRKLKF